MKEENKPKSSYTKPQRIAAVVCVALLLAMYLITLIAALMTSPQTSALFKMSLGSTFVIPIFLWFYISVTKYFMERDRKNFEEALQMDRERKDEKDE